MSARSIIERFLAWRREHRPLVLATVFETQGSTYSKAGHRIVLDTQGGHAGLVSGGCLEGDLALHAAQLAAGGAQILSYDLTGRDEELFGLGIGCSGLLRILLQRLEPADDYQPFARMADCLRSGRAGWTATVIDGSGAAPPAGATLISAGDQTLAWRIEADFAATLRQTAGDASTGATLREVPTEGGRCRVLFAPLRPLPRLLVLGGGLDAVPLVHIAVELGWRVTVADHRAGHLADGRFGAAEASLCLAPSALAATLPLDEFAAALVMSHHLATDRAWLEQLAGSTIRYLGLLGPPARRARLLAELGPTGRRLDPRLYGPAGLDIGADSPESIALSILAQMQAVLRRDAGRS